MLNVTDGRRNNFILQAHLCTVWEDGQYKANGVEYCDCPACAAGMKIIKA